MISRNRGIIPFFIGNAWKTLPFSAELQTIFRQHTVSDAKLVDDVALFAGCHAHFLADVLHVDLQLLDAAIVRISPDGTDDRSIRQHLSGVNGEKRQDIVFCLGQVDLFFINKNLPCIVIDQQVLKAEFPAGVLSFASLCRWLRRTARIRANNSSVYFVPLQLP